MPEYDELRDVKENEMTVDDNDEMTVDDNDEVIESEDEDERNVDEQQRLCKYFERSDLNKTNLSGILLYEDSKELETKTDKPFLGKDKFGKIVTYNTKGDWTKMLYFVEILNYYDHKDHDHAFILIVNEILQNHSIIHDWCQNSKNPGENITHFQFHWGLTNNFNKLNKVMKSQGIKLEDKLKKEKNFLKRQKRKTKNKTKKSS